MAVVTVQFHGRYCILNVDLTAFVVILSLGNVTITISYHTQ